MGLKFVVASEAQIKKILRKRVYHLEYSLSDEDDEHFLAYDSWGDTDFASCMMAGVGAYQWCLRDSILLNFSFQKGGVSYSLPIKDPRVITRLDKLTKKAKDKFWKGAKI